jgi:predicted ATPase with chaperone activity
MSCLITAYPLKVGIKYSPFIFYTIFSCWLTDIRRKVGAKRALILTAARGNNTIIIGPPSACKLML